jgi:hypothetical protein
MIYTANTASMSQCAMYTLDGVYIRDALEGNKGIHGVYQAPLEGMWGISGAAGGNVGFGLRKPAW